MRSLLGEKLILYEYMDFIFGTEQIKMKFKLYWGVKENIF